MKWLILILMLSIFSIANCQQSNSEWTLKNCIDTALLNNAKVRMSEINSNKAQITLKTSNLSFLPSLNGGASHGYNFGQTIDPFTNTFANTRVQYNNFYLNSSVTLFKGLQNHYQKRIAEVDCKSNLYNLEIDRRNLSIEVTIAYLRAKLNSEIVEVAKNQTELTKVQKQRTQDLIEAERITNSDLLKINAQLAKDDYNLVQATNNWRSSLLILQQLIGIKHDTSFTLTDIDEYNLENHANQMSVENEISKLAIEKQLLESKHTKSQLSPSLVLNGSLGSGYSENNKYIDPSGEFIPKPFRSQLNENFYQSVSATLSIPIFNGYRTGSQIKINELELQRIKVEAEQSLSERDNKVKQYRMDVINARSLHESSKTFYESSKLEFENSKVKYDIGIINFSTLMESKDFLFKAKSEMIQSKYQLEFAEVILSFFE